MKLPWIVALLVSASCAAPGPIGIDEPRALGTTAPLDELDAVVEASEAHFARASGGSAGDVQRLEAALEASHALSACIGRPDEMQRWVSFARWADLAREHARSDVVDVDLARALPAKIERLDFIELAAHARLGFQTSVEALCAKRPELLEFPAVEHRIARAELPARVEAWSLVALFRVARERDERLALRFAALAFDRGAAYAADFEELERWLEHDAKSQFRCPKCDHALVARLRACPNDLTPNGEFVVRPRDPR